MGATTKSDGSRGGGAVVRDHHGGFVGGACHFSPLVSDLMHAVLLACQRGVQLAVEVGAQKLTLEIDNQVGMHDLKSVELDRSRYGPLIEEIKELLASMDDFRVVWVRRTAPAS